MDKDARRILRQLDQERFRQQALAREREARQSEGVHAFVSYSHSDKAAARALTERLTAEGLEYDIDEKALQGGDHISQRVADLVRGCTDYVLLLSTASAQSHWCLLEYGIAVGAGKQIWLFMVDQEAEVPPQLSAHLAIRDVDTLVDRLGSRRFSTTDLDEFIMKILQNQPEQFVLLPKAGAVIAWQSPSYTAATREPNPRDLWEDAKWIDEPVLTRIEMDDVEKPTSLVLYRKAPSMSGESRHVLAQRGQFVWADPPLTSTFAPYQRVQWESSSRFWRETLRRLAQRLPRAQ
jgi:hypothetical protein